MERDALLIGLPLIMPFYYDRIEILGTVLEAHQGNLFLFMADIFASLYLNLSLLFLEKSSTSLTVLLTLMMALPFFQFVG